MKSIYIARRVIFSNIPMLIVIMFMALAFTLIFGKLMNAGSSGTPEYQVVLAGGDTQRLFSDFRRGLEANPRLKITVTDEEEARELVRERKAVLALLAGGEFSSDLLAGRGPELVMIRDEQNNLYLAARQEIERELTRVRVAVVAANRAGAHGSVQWQREYEDALQAWKTPPVAVQTSTLGQAPDTEKQVDRTGIGMTVMFVMITVITASGAILDERNRGTWQRILTAPVTRGSVLGGYLLSYFGLGVLQFSILVAAGRLISGVSWGNPLGVAVLTVVFLLCSISLGLVIAGIVRTFQQQQAVSSLVVTATSMLGGLFWSLDIASPLMRTIAKATPQYWAMTGYEQLLYRGLDWSVLRQPIIVLLGFTLVFFIFGVSRIRFE